MADSDSKDPNGRVQQAASIVEDTPRSKAGDRPIADHPLWKELATTLGVATLDDDIIFEASRRAFITDYQGVSADHPFFYGTIGSGSEVRKLRNPKKGAGAFSLSQKRKTVAFMNAVNPISLGYYDQLAQLIDQGNSEKKRLIDSYSGNYRYFRLLPPSIVNEPLYSSGKVVIEEKGGLPSFRIWTGNFEGNEEQDPAEIEGEIYCGNRRLFFFGRRSNVMRLVICREPKKAIPSEIFMGIVLSVSEAGDEPFAARVILIHEDNVAAMERFGNMPVTPGRQISYGQEEFERLWHGTEHMMTLAKGPGSTKFFEYAGRL